MLCDASAERPHSLDRHVRTGIGAPVVDLELSEFVDARCERDDVFSAKCRYRAASGRIVTHGDRPAREQEDDHPQSTVPPFTFTISPVMCRASSEQRKTIGPAMSRGAAIRLTGIVAAIRSRPPSANGCSHISVSTQPGATLFTVMPRFPNSGASDLTREIIAPFDAA